MFLLLSYFPIGVKLHRWIVKFDSASNVILFRYCLYMYILISNLKAL